MKPNAWAPGSSFQHKNIIESVPNAIKILELGLWQYALN